MLFLHSKGGTRKSQLVCQPLTFQVMLLWSVSMGWIGSGLDECSFRQHTPSSPMEWTIIWPTLKSNRGDSSFLQRVPIIYIQLPIVRSFILFSLRSTQWEGRNSLKDKILRNTVELNIIKGKSPRWPVWVLGRSYSQSISSDPSRQSAWPSQTCVAEMHFWPSLQGCDGAEHRTASRHFFMSSK